MGLTLTNTKGKRQDDSRERDSSYVSAVLYALTMLIVAIGAWLMAGEHTRASLILSELPNPPKSAADYYSVLTSLWQYYAVVLSAIGLIVGVVTLIALKNSLELTRTAIKVATDANDLYRNEMAMTIRPWLSVADNFDLTIGLVLNDDVYSLILTGSVDVRNLGQSAATNVWAFVDRANGPFEQESALAVSNNYKNSPYVLKPNFHFVARQVAPTATERFEVANFISTHSLETFSIAVTLGYSLQCRKRER